MRFRIILAILLFSLSACAVSHAESLPVEYRIVPGAGGDYAVITGGAAAENLVIPAKIDGVPVREIDRDAFAGNSVLKTLTVGQGVRSIGMSAFEGCTGLTEVILPGSLTFIDRNAFRDCENLREISMPGIIEAGQIREGAFVGVALTELTLSGGIDLFSPLLQDETLRIAAWQDGWLFRPLADGTLMIIGADGDPRRLEIPAFIGGKQVTAIGEGAFRGNAALKKVTLPEGLKTIGSKAFADCISLREVSLPSALESVGPLAFFRTALEPMTLPESAAENSSHVWFASEDRTDPAGWVWNLLADGSVMISGYTVQDHSLVIPDEIDGKPVTAVMQHESRYLSGDGIDTVKLPAGLKVIGERAFYRFGALRELAIPAALEEIGDGAFYNCARVDHLKLPATLKRLGREAFNYCRRLGTIILPEGLEEIGARTFEGCGRLGTVRLPATLKIIGERAFAQTNLTQIKLPEGLEVIRKGAFMEHRIGEVILPASLKHLSAEAFYSFRPNCPKKVSFLNPDTELESGIFGYTLRSQDDNINNPLNWIDLYHEQPAAEADWKSTIQLSCFEGSTADRMYTYKVKKVYLR
jgi:hypothetical protein